MSSELVSADMPAVQPLEPASSEGRLEAAALLGSNYILARVSIPALGLKKVCGWIADGERSLRLSGRLLTGAVAPGTALMLLRAGAGTVRRSTAGVLILEAEGGRVILTGELSEATVSVERFAREHLAADPSEARRLLEEIVGVIGRCRGGVSATAIALASLRRTIAAADTPLACGVSDACEADVDGMWRLGPAAFYVRGWLHDASGHVRHLWLTSPEGRRIDIGCDAHRHRRPAIAERLGVSPGERVGFAALARLPEESVLRREWTLQIELVDGARVDVQVPAIIDDPAAAQAALLSEFEADPLVGDSLLSDLVFPAATMLLERRIRTLWIEHIEEFGRTPHDPEVTIVTPLAATAEWLEHQLTQFAHDPELRGVEIVFVHAAAQRTDGVERLAEQLFDLYRVPFRLIRASRDETPALLNNLAASQARGRLLLIAADLLPTEPGWLPRMVRFHDATPRLGALAPKLLHSDGSIHHAGLSLVEPGDLAGHRTLVARYRGLHRCFLAANVAAPVDAVAATGLLMRADLYREIGGLRGVYVGDRALDEEASDLCLRLRKEGRESWYLPEVELFHLDQAPMSEDRARGCDRYNHWLQRQAWDDQLELMNPR